MMYDDPTDPLFCTGGPLLDPCHCGHLQRVHGPGHIMEKGIDVPPCQGGCTAWSCSDCRDAARLVRDTA